jgi:hypothetical protein
MKSFKSLFLGTAVLAATVLGGCFLNDGGKSDKQDEAAQLSFKFKVKDVESLSKSGLGKSSAITLSKLVVTLTSSVGSDAVIRDTILASDTGDFTSDANDDQQITKQYAVKPLRNWTVQVKTLDVNDSIIHGASAIASNLEIGETRALTLNLVSKFVVYRAKFYLPDSLGSSDTNVTQKQKLYINRFMMVVDGDTVRDTSSSPGFFAASPAFHTVDWNYVRSDTVHSLELYVFADSLGDWDPSRPIFGDTILITSTDTTYTPDLPYTGPGSPSDPNYDPSNPGGAKLNLTINIDPVPVVQIIPGICSDCLPKRKD